MQTIYLDISNKGVVPTVYAKQNDVGRKFAVILTDSGLPYIPEIGSVFSVWYKGASGEGNYTDIGNKSAFSLNGNKVEIEMIVQMLSAHGDGILCLTLNSPDGNQISSWNIPYMCEIVPGSESEKAEEYYTAFSKAVEELPYPDETLSIKGKAADAAAVGEALAKKADISYTKKIGNPRNLLDNSDFRNPVNQRGQTVYNAAGTYSIDRWFSPLENIVTVNADSINVSGNYFVQKVEAKKLTGDKYTIGFMLKTGLCMGSVDVTGFSVSKEVNVYAQNDIRVTLYRESESVYQVYICPYASIDLLYAFMYKGEYTAETLPEYQPKGYGAELAECQRYYQIRSTNNIAAVDMRPTMRLSSPTITSVTGGYAYSADL